MIQTSQATILFTVVSLIPSHAAGADHDREAEAFQGFGGAK